MKQEVNPRAAVAIIIALILVAGIFLWVRHGPAGGAASPTQIGQAAPPAERTARRAAARERAAEFRAAHQHTRAESQGATDSQQ